MSRSTGCDVPGQTRFFRRRTVWVAVALFMVIAPSCGAQAADSHVFRLNPYKIRDEMGGEEVRTVSVAGTFSNWDKEKYFLNKQSNGTFSRLVELSSGVHHYKFVINGDRWIRDPDADLSLNEPDNFGGFNSGVIVGDDGRKFGRPVKNGIQAKAVKHDPASIDFFNVVSKTEAVVRVRVLEKDIGSAEVHYTSSRPGRDIEKAESRKVSMRRLKTEMGFDVWEALLSVPADAGIISYEIELRDGAFKHLAGTWTQEMKASFPVPEWAQHVIWYQIMPDRFRNGDETNDPDGALPWRWDWSKPYSEGEKSSSYSTYWNREFGGDVRGLIDSLDYLADLGVTGIYLTPVFKARGYSKYNATDYRHIDDRFGARGDIEQISPPETPDPSTWRFTPTDRLFLDFLDEAHRRGFKVIIDGVFNHCGEDHWAFRDVIENERNSPYAGWFIVRNWDAAPKWPGGPAFDYKGWFGFAGLPEFAEDDRGPVEPVRRHIYDITKRWMDPDGDGNSADGVDGWRLDAIDDVTEKFWQDWRKWAKQINPQSYLSGETWRRAPELLQGRHFDALMNYPFAMTSVNFFVRTRSDRALSPARFHEELESVLAMYPAQVTRAMQNLYASHDVDRLASMIRNPNHDYDQKNRLHENPSYDISRPTDREYDVVKLMFSFQMAFPGAPMIWYGDEVGMFGGDDPANRQPMWWQDLMPYDHSDDRIHDGLLNHCKWVIAIRNTYPALRTGSFAKILAVDESKVYVFERRDDRDRLIVALNNDRSPHTVAIPVGTGSTYINLMNRAAVELKRGIIDGLGSSRALIEILPDAPRLRPEEGVLTLDLGPKACAFLLETH